MSTRIAFVEKGKVVLESFDPGPVAAGQVRVRTLASLVSTGTEGIILHQLYDAGSHWDKWLQNRWPFYPGYAAVGVIEEVRGDGERKAGEMVAVRYGHASHQVVPAADCTPVPAGLTPEEAVWFALAKICFMGAKAARYALGDSVLIIGAGPIGQMSVRWARAAGAQKIIVSDPLPKRLDLARQGGATTVITQPIETAKAEIEAVNGGKLPGIVMDTTGNAAVFSAALGLAAKFGKVVLLGDTGTPSLQHLTPDVVKRGLTIVGAHDGHVDAEWTGRRIYDLFFDLVLQQRFSLDNLNWHRVDPAQAAETYKMMTERRGETMGIVFDWTK